MTAAAATVLAAARMAPLALVTPPLGRAWAARVVLAALLTAAVVPFVMAQPATSWAALPAEVLLGLLLGLVAALPFAAAEAAGALLDVGVQPWQARRGARGPLGEAYVLFALALFAAVDGPRLVATAAGRSYLALPIGHVPSAAELVGVGARLVAVGVALAAPALAALLVAELGLTLVGRVQPSLGRAVMAAPLRALVVVLVAAAGVYAAARGLGPTLSLAAHLRLGP